MKLWINWVKQWVKWMNQGPGYRLGDTLLDRQSKNILRDRWAEAEPAAPNGRKYIEGKRPC